MRMWWRRAVESTSLATRRWLGLVSMDQEPRALIDFITTWMAFLWLKGRVIFRLPWPILPPWWSLILGMNESCRIGAEASLYIQATAGGFWDLPGMGRKNREGGRLGRSVNPHVLVWGIGAGWGGVGVGNRGAARSLGRGVWGLG